MPLPNGIIDLRSDTTTFPLPEMYEAMRNAPLGDDVYGDDPTVNRLQEMAAEMTGHAAGLLVASGTMGNLAALMAHCRPADEVILGGNSHIYWDEAGGMAALGGLMAHLVTNQPDGTLRLEEIEAVIRPDDIHAPRTRLVCLENTQNYLGGVALTPEYTRQVAELAHRRGLALHVDGARLFNAAVRLGVPVSALAAPADSVQFCLSKGLCAPVGSLLCGSTAFIEEARRIRKMLGGGMRQAGVLAAAGIVALEVMPARLGEDHRRAALLAEKVAQIPGITLIYGMPHTNMVYVRATLRAGQSSQQVMAALRAAGVWATVEEDGLCRLVTHYWVGDEDVEIVAGALSEVLRG